MAQNRRRAPSRKKQNERSHREVKSIDVLPDDVLLGMFDFYVDKGPCDENSPESKGTTGIRAWQSLVHVCRRWRILVLGSPRRLNMRLICKPETPIRDILDVWPALPLIIVGTAFNILGRNNVIEALRQRNHVCQVDLHTDNGRRKLEKILAAMQLPFPELRYLRLSLPGSRRSPIITDSFLGGSAPRLRTFTLDGIPFPGLPNLLSSANHLVKLWLSNIPYSGYISPRAMVSLLSGLSRLRMLCLEFRFLTEQESQSLPPPKHTILPALDEFHFIGVTEYLEELVTFIDAPQLDEMHIAFLSQINFDCPRLTQFVNRTPTLRACDKAHVKFGNWATSVELLVHSRALEIELAWRELDWELSSLVKVCNPSLHTLSTVESLYIEHQHSQLFLKKYAIKNAIWLQLLLPFTSVENLYISKEIAPGIAAALKELVGSKRTEVLPSLQNIFVERFEPLGPFQKNIREFVIARRLSGHPVAICIRNELVWN